MGSLLDITKATQDKTSYLYLLENIVALIPGHVYWKDKNGKYLGCNDEQARSLGLNSREEIVNKIPYENLSTKEANRLKKSDNAVLKYGKTITLEEPGIREDGSTGVFLTKKTPLYNKDSSIMGMLGVSIDITERKRQEFELKEARIKSTLQEEKIKTLKSVGANIAHELRTPLRSIVCGADAILDYLPDLLHGYELAKHAGLPVKNIFARTVEILKNMPERISREAMSANTVIDMLLMNIKEAELTEKDFIMLSAVESIDQALSRYPFQERQKGWVVWNKENDFKFFGNKLLFDHMIFNLMKNALYYVAAANKDDDKKIYINLERGENQNRIYFKDLGVGIASDVLPKIFDEFFSETMHGTGIGLSFCKTAMKQMGGSIICRSEKSKFTEFILSFPVVK
ncbi:MAG: ATP-binding protein [Gammaproteobacteria bacterium]|jgi:PAS domain S-box-containing protein